ncbi:hypothetical protein ACFQFH_17985 [Halobaculum halobium]|uniref:Uncharacterized protein n=1 Tax=Halobaculum halobium TaxID=3032281 RepID=A0ABD5TF80_9EURY|nr:hypothetical protein [Halobaculum sp. SYNS20]
MHPLVRALLSLAVTPVTLALSFGVAPDPTGVAPLALGVVASAVAAVVTYRVLAAAES